MRSPGEVQPRAADASAGIISTGKNKMTAPTTKSGWTTAPNLPKLPTGIQGLDEITGGGFPQGRPTLVCGGAGSGKTLLAMQFLARGALDFDEAGVFMSFDERLP